MAKRDEQTTFIERSFALLNKNTPFTFGREVALPSPMSLDPQRENNEAAWEMRGAG